MLNNFKRAESSAQSYRDTFYRTQRHQNFELAFNPLVCAVPKIQMSDDPTFECKASNNRIPLPPGTSAFSMRSMENGRYKSTESALLSEIFSVNKSLDVKNKTGLGSRIPKSFRLQEKFENSKSTINSTLQNYVRKKLNVI